MQKPRESFPNNYTLIWLAIEYKTGENTNLLHYSEITCQFKKIDEMSCGIQNNTCIFMTEKS